ncbi:MAG: TetR/AcrR family transcriptional regulator [Pseudomonadota bacterium]
MPRRALSQLDIDSFRNSFCEKAFEIYQEQGYDAVSMRGVAKLLACSPMMAYRYFDNKEAVFAALRAMWFDRLTLELEAVDENLSDFEYLRELATAYAGFARNNPHAYRLLYMVPVHQASDNPMVIRAQQGTRRVLLNATRRVVASGKIKGDPVVLAHTSWASLHGLISLELAHQLTQGASFNQLFPAMLDSMLATG